MRQIRVVLLLLLLLGLIFIMRSYTVGSYGPSLLIAGTVAILYMTIVGLGLSFLPERSEKSKPSVINKRPGRL